MQQASKGPKLLEKEEKRAKLEQIIIQPAACEPVSPFTQQSEVASPPNRLLRAALSQEEPPLGGAAAVFPRLCFLLFTKQPGKMLSLFMTAVFAPSLKSSVWKFRKNM